MRILSESREFAKIENKSFMISGMRSFLIMLIKREPFANFSEFAETCSEFANGSLMNRIIKNRCIKLIFNCLNNKFAVSQDSLRLEK